MTLLPFTVDVEQPTLDDLAERLARTRWPGELGGDPLAAGLVAGVERLRRRPRASLHQGPVADAVDGRRAGQ
jgi:hypothetical protein